MTWPGPAHVAVLPLYPYPPPLGSLSPDHPNSVCPILWGYHLVFKSSGALWSRLEGLTLAFICIDRMCLYVCSLVSSALVTVVEVTLQGMYSVWTHGTSGHYGPSTASLGLPSHPPVSFVELSPVSAGTPLPGER